MPVELSQFLATLLTQEEFRTVYSVAWVAQAYETYGVEELTEMEQESVYSSLGEQLKWSINRLSQAGMRFANFTIEDGRMILRDNPAPHPGNQMYVAALTMGQRFDYLTALRAARDVISGQGLSLDLDPIMTALEDVKWSLQQAKQDMTAEQAKEIVTAREERMRIAREALGGVRGTIH